jgi:hypothetical protein
MKKGVAQSNSSGTLVDSSKVEVPRRSLWDRVVEEFKRFAVMTLYLWVIISIFNLHQRIVLREQGISFFGQGFALVNALILAKVMLVAEDLKLGKRFHHLPPIYAALADSFLFSLIFIAFHYVEAAVIALIRQQPISENVPSVGGGGLIGVLCVAAIMFISLIPYFALRAVGRVIGQARVRSILLTERPAYDADAGTIKQAG